MIEPASNIARRVSGRPFRMSGFLICLLLFSLGCVSNDDPDGQPVSPSPEPSIAVTSLPGTPTEPAPIPSATTFMRPTSAITPTEPIRPPVVDAVIAQAAQDYEVSEQNIELIFFEQRTWSSTALGCPVDGRSYAQIVTSGYAVVMNIDSRVVSYHATEDGTAIIGCDEVPTP